MHRPVTGIWPMSRNDDNQKRTHAAQHLRRAKDSSAPQQKPEMLQGLRMLIKDETEATLYKNVGILYNGYWVNFLRRQSARGCEAGHSTPCSADIQNKAEQYQFFLPTPICLPGVHRDNVYHYFRCLLRTVLQMLVGSSVVPRVRSCACGQR